MYMEAIVHASSMYRSVVAMETKLNKSKSLGGCNKLCTEKFILSISLGNTFC